MSFRPKNISSQIMYLLNPHPHHIRDKESRYLYMNLAMRELLNVPPGFSIEGKWVSEIKPDRAEFFESIKKQEEGVIEKQNSLSLLITAHFGKENRLQPYVFDIHPFFDETGQLVGTLTEARQCPFFSPLDYILGKSPKALTSSLLNTIFTQREREIIFYCYQGCSQKEVGEYLKISHRTFDKKLQGIYEKMGVNNPEGFKKYVEERELNNSIPHHLLASSIKRMD